MCDGEIAASGPLAGADLVARWGFVYDLDEDSGGGFVGGELLLRSDGVLLRRYGGSYSAVGGTTWKYRAWEAVGWWTGEARPTAAVHLLKEHGYGLHQPSPVPIDQQTAGPFPGYPDLGAYL